MKCDAAMFNRMKRLQGQINGILQMMMNERECDEIVTQLSSVRSNVDKTISLMTTQNLVNEIEKQYNISVENVDEALNLIIKSK